jgi:hypothetical protein
VKIPLEVVAAFDCPYLPTVGDVFHISTDILDNVDVHPFRPGVVVEIPKDLTGSVHVVTRTTETWRSGVAHPPAPELRLYEPGVFAYLRHADAYLWKREKVEFRGVLDSGTLTKVLDWVE